MKALPRNLLITAAALLAAGAAYRATCGWQIDPIRQTVSTMSSASAAIVGFVFAALAILLTVNEQPLLIKLRKHGYFADLQRDMFWSATLFFCSTIITIVATFLLLPEIRYTLVAAAFFFAAGSLRMIRAGRNFFKTLELLSNGK